MSKRFWFCSAPIMVVLAAACCMPACGGSSDSDGTAGGGGGYVMDSGNPDQSADATPDTQAETGQPDVSQETSPDATVDVEILEGSLFDLTMPDVVLNDAGATLQECYDCTTAACPAQLTACEGDDKCRTLILCFFQDACFDPTQQMGIDAACAFGCAGKAGIMDQNDPALSLGMDVASCMQGSCGEECGLMEGGTPPPVDSGPQDAQSEADTPADAAAE